MPILEPPLPVAAVFDDPSKTLTVTWDQPLRPGPITIGNWDACPDLLLDRRHDSIAGGTITDAVTTIPMAGGVDICFNLNTFNYLAAPQDVVGLRGTPAAPVVNFPFVLIP